PSRDRHSFPTRRSSDLLRRPPGFVWGVSLIPFIVCLLTPAARTWCTDRVTRRQDRSVPSTPNMRRDRRRARTRPSCSTSPNRARSEEHTSELQSLAYLV